VSIGTSRQPTTFWPSSRTTSSKTSSQAPGGRVGRQEDHADPVAAAAGHVEAEPEALALEKAVRDLAKDAGAIAGFGVTPGGRPVAEAVQNLERLLDDLARLVALNVRDESDTAGVALHRRLVEAPSIR